MRPAGRPATIPMATRHLYFARHGDADALGTLTTIGCQQSQLLGRRLEHLPIDAVWEPELNCHVGRGQSSA